MQPNKIDAIYALRDAAEQKGVAENQAAKNPSAAARAALLDAQLRLESKTQDAIEACHKCGSPHAATDPHQTQRADKVIDVAFDRKDKRP